MAIRVRTCLLGAVVALGVASSHAAGAPAASSWIVFSAAPHGVGPAQLFRVGAGGGEPQQITTGNKPATDPSFAPDGTRVVFARLGSGIFVVGLDGRGLRRLTSGARDHFPVWSPNGKQIAFVRLYRKSWRVYVMTASGQRVRRLPLAPPGGRPSWAANGRSLFVPEVGALARLDGKTGRVQRRTELQLDLLSGQSATVSPNGRRVAFVGLRPPSPGCDETFSCTVFALYLADLPGGRRRRFANDAGPAGWSPDSKQVAFVQHRALAVWPVAGGTRTSIGTGAHAAEANTPPAWQPR